MAADGRLGFEDLMRRATEHKKKAQWELAENCLRDAERLASRPRFPNAAQNRVKVQLELAEVTRRHGNYQDAIKAQEMVVQSQEIDDLQKCKVYGELGVNYRHTDRIAEAAKTFQKHYDLAKKLAFEMDAEACRAVGNLAMSKYQLGKEQNIRDLLLESISLQQTRVATARQLQVRLENEFAPNVDSIASIGATKIWIRNWIARLQMWESIGVSRLVLSYIANEQLAEAISSGQQAVEMTQYADWADPTVRALCRFMHGHALLKDGRVPEAKFQFDFPKSIDPGAYGICTPAIALCKEPSAEHRGYLQEVIKADVDLSAYDEQGYSALDYAVYSNDTETANLLRRGLVSQIDLDGMEGAFKMANVRKHFREIFHGQFRPIIQKEHSDCLQALRSKYLDILREEDDKRERFDWLRAVSYEEFVERQALPHWGMTDEMTQEFAQIKETSTVEPFLIFFSYRWIGKDKDPKSRDPDCSEHYQYKRMLDALEQLLEMNPNVKEENVYIWLDCACIDQVNGEAGRKERGINALPMIVAQCDAMISIVDDEYYNRAWCAVETMIVQTLKESSQFHHWYEHILHDKDSPEPYGMLRKGPPRQERAFQPSTMKVTVESDRRYIEFLERQSMLLGKAASGA